MKSKMLLTLTIALMISISLIAFTPIYGKKPPETLLTEEELAFTAAVGEGEYAYNMCERMAYDFGTVTDELGRELWKER